MEYLENIESSLISLLKSAGIFAPILSCLLILIESMIPILPIFVFISINFLAFGNILGFIVSYIFVILGCMLSFYLFRKNFHTWFIGKKTKEKYLNKGFKWFDTLAFPKLVILIIIPFAPTFIINIAAGLTNIKPKKYLAALLIGKMFFIFFWGYIGTNIIETINDIKSLLSVIIMLISAYLISFLISKWFKIK